MKLSVIVPVYNVEKFLTRCLDSLLRQGLEPGDWEVICVNDGSPDNSAAILAEYQAKHPDIIKVVTQENQGLGGARNTGTALARGEYVTYLDSDDYIIDNAYRYFLDHFCEEEPDVLCYEYMCIYTNGKVLHDSDAIPDGEVIFDGDGMEAYNRWPLPFVWSKFYKRSFLEYNHIKSQIVACQDELFNFDVFCRHPHTRILSSNVCRYELGNEQSIQRTTNKSQTLKTMNDMFLNIDYIRDRMNVETMNMEVGSMRAINNMLNVYHKKLVMVLISRKDWNNFYQKMKALPPFEPVSTSDTWNARWLGEMKKWTGRSYLFYLLFYFIRTFVFFKMIRPMMLKKKS